MASGEDASRRCRVVRAKPMVPCGLAVERVGPVELLADVIGDSW